MDVRSPQLVLDAMKDIIKKGVLYTICPENYEELVCN